MLVHRAVFRPILNKIGFYKIRPALSAGSPLPPIVQRAGIPAMWHSDCYVVPLLDAAVKAGPAGVYSPGPAAGG